MFTYQRIAPTQQWQLINGRWFRHWIARRSDGALRVVAYPDPEVTE
jgi:hypothetical protein